jgi:uncharacterized membrane protein YhaH (DUF805 family)
MSERFEGWIWIAIAVMVLGFFLRAISSGESTAYNLVTVTMFWIGLTVLLGLGVTALVKRLRR